MANGQIPLNPLSAFFRGFQGAQTSAQQQQQAAQAAALNEQLKQLQILTAQRQLAEILKTPEQRAQEAAVAANISRVVAGGGFRAAEPGLEGLDVAIAQALTPQTQTALETGAITPQAAITTVPAVEFETPVPGLGGAFVDSPALARQRQEEALRREEGALRGRARIERDIAREFQTPAEKAAEEASLAESRLKTAKSTAIFDQIQRSASSGGKNTTPVFDPTGTTVIAYEYFDPIKGATDLIDIKTPKDAEDFKLALDQSNKFDDDPAVKNYSSAIASIRGIQNLASDPNATAADDTALIFAFMKSIDPRSTVREGEQASVQNAAGIPDRIRNLYNNAAAGNRLTPTQRVEIFGAAEKSVSGLKTGYDLARTRFIDKSRRSKLDENIVVGPALDHRAVMREFSTSRPPSAQSSTLPSVATQQQFNALPSGSRYLGEDGKTYQKP